MVDKACQEIESELRKIRPEGGKVTATDLAQAILSMNLKLRRKEGVAAYEMHPTRKLESGPNIQLDDVKLRVSDGSSKTLITATNRSPHSQAWRHNHKSVSSAQTHSQRYVPCYPSHTQQGDCSENLTPTNTGGHQTYEQAMYHTSEAHKNFVLASTNSTFKQSGTSHPSQESI